MQRHPWSLALGVALLAAWPLHAEIIKGAMSVKGAEMS